MLFSYYFDVDKTHLLNCQFRVLQFTEKAAGVIEIMFSGEISEHRNGVRLKRETKVATFSFPPTAEGETKHDIDFTRVRFADQKKWIFTVINNKSTAQKLEVGLISTTANKNPLGMDIYHDSDEFEVELKANNLSILEPTYTPPVLTQTMVDTRFEQTGYPERFSSYSANYDGMFQNYKLSDFTQDFLEPVPAGAKFKMQVDIAPMEVIPLAGNKLFDLTIPGIGLVTMRQNALEYMLEGGSASDIVRIFFDSVQPTDFWNNGMTTKAKMTIEGDGMGQLKIQYNGQVLQAFYDHTKEFSRIEFRGELARLDN